MNSEQFADLIRSARAVQDEILAAKGRDYTAGTDHAEDRLGNFKSLAKRLGLTPMQVWAVYFAKHADAVLAYAKGQTESEPIEQRLHDVANYALLGLGLVEEEGWDHEPNPV